MAKLRIGVIGLGMASAPHARSLLDLKDRVEVAAAFSPTGARRKAFSDTYGFPICDEAKTIFADPSIAAVMILTPPNTHLELVREAARAGKHVLLEKPLEITQARAEALVEAAERASIKLGIVLQHRFRPVSEALAKLIDEGRLGEIVSASARLHNWRPQSYYDQPGRGTLGRDGGGVLLTQAIHTLDLLVSLAGLPEEVRAYAATSKVHRMETEDLAMAAIRFVNGAIGTVSATTCAYPGYPDDIDIIGTRGMARLGGRSLAAFFHDGAELLIGDEMAGGAGADPMAFSHHHHRAVLADFLDAVDAGREPRVNGREALKVHRLINAILAAAESGQPQRL
ncbi:Gfo/Idh/MocA family protein [Sinorhizobium mexicanum]|uniref:Gfo/Idh/MocA family oxidoreductase n=1 Tax=Sinorhizobium mexicanum TaxID=375549 RepID=A0A859QJ07_9HYPH|nr:Gfo/Idh/MocA family oxidoreductase [Sinorhizobium mexicanum]MBP1886627.1 putative dehydrogenase [Sinorhizobium mexicanum]QLL65852.1 Gfo/Idh/MocA family oxidoreductase [Sinorhizobium mexicanum]